jgi:hypothetical protein
MKPNLPDPLQRLPRTISDARQAYLKIPAAVRQSMMLPMLQAIRSELDRLIVPAHGDGAIAGRARRQFREMGRTARLVSRYERIQRFCAGQYVELFARSRHLGFDAWGNEIDLFVEAAE